MIIAVPAPRRTAAEFPLFVFPGLEAGIGPDGFLCCTVSRLRRINQDLRVRTDTVGAPYELTRVQVISADVPANTILSPRDTDEHFVTDDQRSPCHRLPQFRITILSRPDDFARFGVKRVDLCIQRRHQNLAVRISDTAVHQIATGYRRRELILLWHRSEERRVGKECRSRWSAWA